MAVSSTPSAVLIVDQYILRAYKRAGIIPIEFAIGADSQWTARASHGREVLNTLIENVAAVEGFLPHFTAFEIVQLTAGDPAYVLDSDIVNVVDDGSYIPASNGVEVIETDSETPVCPMSQFAWNQLSNKAVEGTPVKYYLDRNGSDLTIYLWPIPSEAGKIRLRSYRIPGSNSTGSDNVDLKRHWGKWIVEALAYEFATEAKLALDERVLLRSDRDASLAKIKSFETSNEGPDIVMVHTTPWSGRSC